MGIIARDSGGADFALPTEGMQSAVCCEVEDLGERPNPFNDGKPQHKCRIIWQIDEINPRWGKRFEVSGIYTVSLGDKATLRRTLETWRGRKFTQDELNGFDLEKLIGVPCQVQIQHKVTTQGRTFANVVAVVPLGKGMEALKPLDYTPTSQRPGRDGLPKGSGPAEVEELCPF